MKKLSKIIVLIIILTLIACVSTTVYADGDGILDLDSIGGDSSNDETDEEIPDITPPKQETTEPEVTEPEVTEPEVTEPETTEPEVKEPNSTTSTYEESIPHAGIEDTILMGTAFVVFAVIGIYTFMKLSEYSNI